MQKDNRAKRNQERIGLWRGLRKKLRYKLIGGCRQREGKTHQGQINQNIVRVKVPCTAKVGLNRGRQIEAGPAGGHFTKGMKGIIFIIGVLVSANARRPLSAVAVTRYRMLKRCVPVLTKTPDVALHTGLACENKDHDADQRYQISGNAKIHNKNMVAEGREKMQPFQM